MNDDLDFIEEAIRKQRTYRAVDQARGQRLLLGGAPLALEKTAGDAAGGIGLLYVIDGQREEVLAWLGFLARHYGGQHDRVVHRTDHGSTRLTRDLAGLQRDGMCTVRKFLRYLIEHLAFLSR